MAFATFLSGACRERSALCRLDVGMLDRNTSVSFANIDAQSSHDMHTLNTGGRRGTARPLSFNFALIYVSDGGIPGKGFAEWK